MKRVVDQRDQQRSNQKMGGHTVTLTTQVKEELARVTVSRPSSRRAEVSALARFTATIHTVSGQVLVEFDVDSDNIARRLQTEIDDLYHRESTLISRAKSAWLLAEGNTFGAYLLPSFLARCQMRRQHGGVPFWLVEVSLNRDVPAL